MPSGSTKQLVNALRDVDDLVHLITGNRIRKLVYRGLILFGEDIKNKAVGKETIVDDPEDPYNILGLRREASDIVVKAAFRSLAREYHPDTGTKSDPQAFQRATEAYDKIMYERHGG